MKRNDIWRSKGTRFLLVIAIEFRISERDFWIRLAFQSSQESLGDSCCSLTKHTGLTNFLTPLVPFFVRIFTLFHIKLRFLIAIFTFDTTRAYYANCNRKRKDFEFYLIHFDKIICWYKIWLFFCYVQFILE